VDERKKREKSDTVSGGESTSGRERRGSERERRRETSSERARGN
jgi:hypothetical protein